MGKDSNKTTYQTQRTALTQKLQHSAFRYGASAFRLGLVPQGISDHLPIQTSLPHGAELISWNMLADDHLYNNFMNISGQSQLADAILQALSYSSPEQISPAECVYFNRTGNRLYHFFTELARYLYQQAQTSDAIIKVTKTTLANFLMTDDAPSLLQRSRDVQVAKERAQAVRRARLLLNGILLDETHPKAHEFKLAIRHSLELYHHIEGPKGALQWPQRLRHLRQHQPLLTQLRAADLLCLQECTSPEDMRALLTQTGKTMAMIDFRVNHQTNDHCVIFYNSEKYTLVGDPYCYALHGKKPCIAVRLHDHVQDIDFIVASIHHPGGDANELPEIMQSLRRLDAEQTLPFYMAGDFNHELSHFQPSLAAHQDLRLVFPQHSTMAGCDFGNLNRSIDGILTSRADLVVNRITDLPLSPPAAVRLLVRFGEEKFGSLYATSRFFCGVSTSATATECTTACEALGQSRPAIGARITL